MKYLKLYEKFDKQPMFMDTYEFENLYNTDYITKIKNKLELIMSIPTSIDDVEDDGEDTYFIWRTKNGKYIITDGDIVLNYEEEKKSLKRGDSVAMGDDYSSIFLSALKKLVKKMSSYKFQKEYLTKHPDRVAELKPFGYDEKIKEEFADIIEGGEFGFFNLKN